MDLDLYFEPLMDLIGLCSRKTSLDGHKLLLVSLSQH